MLPFTTAYGSSDRVGLLYSIEQCQFVKVAGDNSLVDSHNNPIAIANFQEQYIFEARIFNTQGELRWLNQNNGLGRSALIVEGEGAIQNWQDTCEINYLESLPQQYLLWGQKTEQASTEAGWQKLSSARIGTLAIPLGKAINRNQRVYLKTREYLGEIDQNNGNVAVVEERLVKLEVK